MVSKAMSGVNRPVLEIREMVDRKKNKSPQKTWMKRFFKNCTSPDSIDVFDGIIDFLSQLLLIRLHLNDQYSVYYGDSECDVAHVRKKQLECRCAVTHLDQLVGEAFMENSVDSCPSWQRNCIYFVSRALDQLLKIHSQVLNRAGWQKASEEARDKWRRFKRCNTGTHVSSAWLTHCSSVLVLCTTSSGLCCLYSSASLFKARSWLCKWLRKTGKVSRMWFVSCCKYFK